MKPTLLALISCNSVQKLRSSTPTLPALLSVLLLLASCSSTPKQTQAPVAEQETPVAEVVAEAPSRPFPDDSFHDLLVAEFAVRRRRYDLALGNYLQQAHQTRDPGVTARATHLAQFLNADKATLDAAQLWVELEPDSLEAQYTAATILAKNKRPMDALSHMAIVLKQGGKTNFAAIAASALPLPEEGRQNFERELDQLAQQYPQNPQLLTAKSLLLQQRGEAEQALTLIQQVLFIDEQDLHAVIVEARLLQQLKREDEAFDRLEKVVAQFPKNRRLRLQYARMLMAKDINKAKQQFEVLLQMSPKDPDLLLSLGLISKESKQFKDAEHYFQRLLASGKRSTESHYYLGQLAEQREEWQPAIEHYKNIPPGTDFLAAINRITRLYLKQGRNNTAREHLVSVRQQYPEHAVRLYLLEAELITQSGDIKQAHQLLSEALLQNPQNPSLLYSRSIISDKLGLMPLMEQDLRGIIKQDSNNATALNALGYVLANRTDRLQEARQLITRALEIKPNDPAILDSMGWVEYRLGNLNRSVELLTEAYKAFPDQEVAAHLGEVLWQLNMKAQALQVWQQALQRSLDSTILRATIKRLSPGTTLAPQPATDEASPEQ